MEGGRCGGLWGSAGRMLDEGGFAKRSQVRILRRQCAGVGMGRRTRSLRLRANGADALWTRGARLLAQILNVDRSYTSSGVETS